MPHNRVRGRIVRMITLLMAGAAACRGPEGPAGPGGPAGGGASFMTASGTSSLVATEELTRYTQIPGLSANVEIPAGRSGQVLIETDGGIQLNSDVVMQSCFIDVAVFVDGAQVGSERRVQVLNTATVIYAVGTYGFSVQSSIGVIRPWCRPSAHHCSSVRSLGVGPRRPLAACFQRSRCSATLSR